VLRLKIKTFAEYDLAESMDWYELQQPGLGIDFLKEIDKTIDYVSQNPLAFEVRYKRKGIAIRFAVLHRFPFVLVYFIDEPNNQLIIEGIWHNSRNPKKLEEQIKKIGFSLQNRTENQKKMPFYSSNP
jgi:toxin ParE1/3/4